MKTSPRVVAYLRISKDVAATELGVERQRKAVAALAKSRGWSDVRYVTDNDVSAYDARAERPGYDEVLALVSSGQVDVVAAYSLERITRSIVSSAPFLTAASDNGVMISLVNGGDIDCSSPAGMFFATVLAGQAAMESQMISLRTRAKHAEIAAAGGSNGGRRCFGYTDDGMDIVPAEAAAIRAAADDLIAGRVSMGGIAQRWNDSGLLSTAGRPWDRTAVRKLLGRPRLEGVRVHLGDRYPAAWPSVLDADTFAALQAELADPGRLKYAASARRILQGSGVYVCGRCGGPMKAYNKHETRRADGRRPDPVRHYRCSDCNMSRPAVPVDEWVDAFIVAALQRDDVRAMLTPGEPKPAAVEDLEPLLAKRRTMTRALADGLVDADEALATLADLKRRIEATAPAPTSRGRGSLAPPGPEEVAAWYRSQLDPATRGRIVEAMATVKVMPRRESPDVPAVVEVKVGGKR